MEKRLFIGLKIHPSPGLLDFYSILRNRFETEKIRWVDIENMHITLKYLGNTDINLIPRISETLQSMADKFKPFQLEIRGLGRFVKNKRTSVLWLGVNDNEMLDKLANSVINEIQSFGFEPENRPYRAHLTLGRVKNCNDESIFEMLEKDYPKIFMQFVDVERFILFESITVQNILKYQIVEEFSFNC